MAVIAPSRARAAALALSVTCLVLAVAIFGFPALITGISGSAVGPVFGAGLWLAPALLAFLALYGVRSAEWSVEAVVLAGLGVLTLVTLLLNLRTVVTSPGAFTYEGRGTFVGPFIALAFGSMLAFAVLADETVTLLES